MGLALLLLVQPVFAQSALEKRLFEYINTERIREKIKPLFWDQELYLVALEHSKDMAATGVTAHEGSDKSLPHDRIERARIFSAKSGENVARDTNIISAHTMLMESLGHRENILEPSFTHGAVAVVPDKQFLYVTELFIEKVGDVTVARARDVLLKQYNFYRQSKKMGPLVLSESLSRVAQSHANLQEKLKSLSPLLAAGSLARDSEGGTRVAAYTTTDLLELPSGVHKDLEAGSERIGIGFKRILGELCNGGCYLVVLVFG